MSQSRQISYPGAYDIHSVKQVASPLVNLIPELLSGILQFLEFHDILQLRFASKACYYIVQWRATELTRNLIGNNRGLKNAHSLYQSFLLCNEPSLDYIFGLSRRSHICQKLANFLARYHLRDIYNVNWSRESRASRYAPLLRTIVSNIVPHLLIIFHFLETYSASILRLIKDKPFVTDDCHKKSALQLQVELLQQYNPERISETSKVFSFLTNIIGRRLRPPSFATGLERQLRGWTKVPATPKKLVWLEILGGLDPINRVLCTSGYDKRIDLLNNEVYRLINIDLPRYIAPEASTQLPKIGRVANPAPGVAVAESLISIVQEPLLFNLVDLADSTNSVLAQDYTVVMSTGEFLALLRSDEMISEFELRNC